MTSLCTLLQLKITPDKYNKTAVYTNVNGNSLRVTSREQQKL